MDGFGSLTATPLASFWSCARGWLAPTLGSTFSIHTAKWCEVGDTTHTVTHTPLCIVVL